MASATSATVAVGSTNSGSRPATSDSGLPRPGDSRAAADGGPAPESTAITMQVQTCASALSTV
jgi:hypothetical protein